MSGLWDKQREGGTAFHLQEFLLINIVRLGNPCCGTVRCFCVPGVCAFAVERAVHTEVVVRRSVHSGYSPGFSKLVIRKASRREWEKKESRWRPLFFNEIFDIFSLCFERRDKGDREGGKRRVDEQMWETSCRLSYSAASVCVCVNSVSLSSARYIKRPPALVWWAFWGPTGPRLWPSWRH